MKIKYRDEEYQVYGFKNDGLYDCFLIYCGYWDWVSIGCCEPINEQDNYEQMWKELKTDIVKDKQYYDNPEPQSDDYGWRDCYEMTIKTMQELEKEYAVDGGNRNCKNQ